MGPRRPETSVKDYHSTLRNIQEELDSVRLQYLKKVKGKFGSVLYEEPRHCRNIGEWRYSSTHSSPSQCVEASGQLCVPSVLVPGVDLRRLDELQD
jgi:hypothetical protein